MHVSRATGYELRLQNYPTLVCRVHILD